MTRKPFGQQKGGQRKSTLASLKKTITELSGGDERELLEALLASRYCKRAASSTGSPGEGSPSASGAPEPLKNESEGQPNLPLPQPPPPPTQLAPGEIPLHHLTQPMTQSSDQTTAVSTSLTASSSSTSSPSTSGTPKKPQRGLLDAIQDAQTKLNKLLTVLLTLYKKEKNHNKKQWSSIVAAALKYDEMREFGFPISRQSYARARAHSEEHGPGAPAPSFSGQKGRRSSGGDDDDEGSPGPSPTSGPTTTSTSAGASSSSNGNPSSGAGGSSHSGSGSGSGFVDHGYAGVPSLSFPPPAFDPAYAYAAAAQSLAAINNPNVVPQNLPVPELIHPGDHHSHPDRKSVV